MSTTLSSSLVIDGSQKEGSISRTQPHCNLPDMDLLETTSSYNLFFPDACFQILTKGPSRPYTGSCSGISTFLISSLNVSMSSLPLHQSLRHFGAAWKNQPQLSIILCKKQKNCREWAVYEPLDTPRYTDNPHKRSKIDAIHPPERPRHRQP